MTETRSKINIIIADDHQLVIDGLKSMLLKETQYEVIAEAPNGKQALEEITAAPETFQLLITDITMPLLGGIDLCRLVKAQYPHIKIPMLSMHNSISIVKDALAAEADGYMLKNTGQDEFLRGMDRILQHGTYFSQDILPIIFTVLQKEKSLAQKSDLTQREKEVLELIVQEFTSREIADKLHISKQTVDTHRMNIMQKTNCQTLVGLIKYAIRSGFIR